MRILLARDSFTPTSPRKATTFIEQLVRQAPFAGHELRELVVDCIETDDEPEPFRTTTRRRLDEEIGSFDPQVVHVHGVSLLGHLVLETGAPYLISAFSEDFLSEPDGLVADSPIQQAFENAARVLVDSPAARQSIQDQFGELDTIAIIPDMTAASSPADSYAWLWEVYRLVAATRRAP
ncbi:MAG TPA: hypothetical protein VFI31_08620 [Pirellulales bacterium]|nr:hypothetical protein [Pirellulales bacterium]